MSTLEGVFSSLYPYTVLLGMLIAVGIGDPYDQTNLRFAYYQYLSQLLPDLNCESTTVFEEVHDVFATTTEYAKQVFNTQSQCNIGKFYPSYQWYSPGFSDIPHQIGFSPVLLNSIKEFTDHIIISNWFICCH